MGDIKTFEARVVDFAATEAGGLTRTANPNTMTDEQRRDLIREVEAGDVMGIRFKALAFGDGANANGARLTAAQIDEVAATARGRDLVTDHAWSVAGVVGEVTGGEARDEGAERVLILEHEITDPAAMVPFLRRQWRKFSVALDAAGWTERNGEVWANSPVRLVHNAFVSDPAYDKARVVENHRTQGVKMSEQTDKAPDQAARIAELEGALSGALAKIKELEGSLEAREGEVFEAAFSKAAAEGRVLPSSRAQFEAIRKAAGLTAAVALFSAYPEQGALPTKTIGTGAPAPVQPKTFNADAAAALITKAGGLKEKKQ